MERKGKETEIEDLKPQNHTIKRELNNQFKEWRESRPNTKIIKEKVNGSLYAIRCVQKTKES